MNHQAERLLAELRALDARIATSQHLINEAKLRVALSEGRLAIREHARELPPVTTANPEDSTNDQKGL